ncbi:sodium-translocating pyrophosphatase [bacterium]|nr:sodium-translocating pyrophosphatase [bacterium]MCP5462552.1 sodium-translocating pyrophosphatase [bacterium]
MKKLFFIVFNLLMMPTYLYASESAPSPQIPMMWWIAPVCSILALVFAYLFYKEMMSKSEGNETMKEIAQHVREGAKAYLRQQYKVVFIFFVIAFIMFIIMSFVLNVQSKMVPFAFITGGFFSGLAGFLGMRTATNASSRTAQGASISLNQGLQVAFRSGAVMGLVVVGLGLLDICLWFLLLYKLAPVLGHTYTLTEITVTMLCFGMGASSQALFARVGGGIFTKAADVGADLVGKVEAGIPEDDPRNPATIADNVGDNVGDVAGMGADLYESYCGSILATAALGAAAFSGTSRLNAVVLPMIIAGLGVLFSIIGIYMVRTKEDATQKDLLHSLLSGVIISSVLIIVSSFFCVRFFLPENWNVFFSIITGLIAGIIIGQSTEYYTSSDFNPTKQLADQSQTGPATLIIGGVALGMLSTGIPVITIGLGMILSYAFAGGFSDPSMGLYGISIASVGMLSTLGITLATDAYGPIADNAGGNAEMSGLGEKVRKRTDALDSLGNTTAATGKGFAIGSAALTALALLAAYIEEIRIGLERAGQQTIEYAGQLLAVTRHAAQVTGNKLATLHDFMLYYDITLMNPKVLIGMFIGAMMAFVFCALTIQAVGRAASKMVHEVRRQFKEMPGIMKGTQKPDYASCVGISTAGAQKEMILPSMIAIFVPVIIGLLLNVAGIMGLLAGGLTTGFVLAVMLNNSGGAWDNAKKYIESGILGGKGSEPHKASVVGDTVGDPFKDTSGPSLNILIKLMSMVSVVAAGLTVKYAPIIAQWLGMD